MPSVLFDSQIFDMQRRGGISRYFATMGALFDRSDDVDLRVGALLTRNDHLLDVGLGVRRARGLPHRGEARVLGTINRAYTRTRKPAALRHFTFYDERYLATDGPEVKVCTIVDMIPESRGDGAGASAHRGKRAFVDSCDALICISHATKSELLRLYGPIDKPLAVTHLGVQPEFFARSPLRSSQEPYLLFVGQRGGYKSFRTLLDAFVSLADQHADLHLRCVGGAGFSTEEQQVVRAAGLTRRVHHEIVPEHALPGVYANARVFCFPSLDEGFGLPVVEALAAGTPTVLCDNACFREVADDAATYFAAGDVGDLVETLSRELADRPLLDDAARERRRRRAQDFTWERTAQGTLDFYASLL